MMASPALPPNVVIIMCDQLRADFTRAAGFALDTMPFLDEFGRSGVRFERAYTPMPICAPARCSLFTGRFPAAHRVRQNSAISHLYKPEGAADLVDLLRERGFSISLVGKNHSHLRPAAMDFAALYSHQGGGRADTRTADEQAMDEWLGTLAREQGSFSLAPAPFPIACQPPVRVVRDAIECVDTVGADGRPFFLWLSFAEPHNPYQVPEPYFGLFPAEEVPERAAGPEALEHKTGPLGDKWRWERAMIERIRPGYDAHWRRYRANYCGMLRLLDDQIHRFIDHLRTRSLLENTYIVFLADHGDYAGDYGLQRKGVGLPECLVRVPLLVWGPGVAAESSLAQEVGREAHVSTVDVMPTLCEALSMEIPFGVQGRSLWPLLTGERYPREEFRSVYAEHGFGGLHYGEHEFPPLHFAYDGRRFDELNTVSQSGTTKMVRMGRWKLTYDMVGSGELYDLATDPAELRNRFDDPACLEVQRRLVEELLRWTIRAEDDLPVADYLPKRAAHNWYGSGATRE